MTWYQKFVVQDDEEWTLWLGRVAYDVYLS